ncbi:hypothetical protein [Paraliomyxa miuraensis]|uniref:hypothetical protein n=1 Tax=Paraliomyxa miuraensis TaxID=376150 RepID=UPI00224FCB8D|nr:hypothetical protein [Paraliomyxa miuraensis]MCX4241490.1 hypothetical protein [Paraliomyxa miuraensis]
MPSRSLIRLGLVVGLAGCPAKRDDGGSAQTPKAQGTEPAADGAVAVPPTADDDDDAERNESAHHVVFADRTSQAYLLLLTEGSGHALDREALAELVRKALAGADDEPEAKLLLEMVATEPRPPQGDPSLDPSERDEIRHRDLLGLHLDLLPVAPAGEEPLIPLEVLRDPISTRALTDAERTSLPARRHALVLRAHYRNRYGIRGLRLLQTLVRIVAIDRKALVHDPDTGETMGVEAFTARRLQSTVGNVADQVVVVPFPDERNGEGSVRLTTRGMRRFGSVDLELDGLPREVEALEAATHLLYGLAFKMVRAGEYDQEGYAVEVDDVIEVTHHDVTSAYAGQTGKVPRCDGCPERVRLHLVERPAEAHDPIEHVVARIVAPRVDSDAADYDHPAWVRGALADLLGVR